MKIVTPSGKQKHVLVNGISYTSNIGRIYKFIGVVKDITTRITTLQNLKAQNRKLKEIAWAQSYLVRGPLSDILGISKIIKGDLVSAEETNKLLHQIHEAAEKLDAVIKDVVSNASSFEEIQDDFE